MREEQEAREHAPDRGGGGQLHNPHGAGSAPRLSTEASRARGAVAALFLVNGAMTGNLVPRFPDLKAELGALQHRLRIRRRRLRARRARARAPGWVAGAAVRVAPRGVGELGGDRRQPHADRPRAVVARARRRAGGGGRPGLLRRHRRQRPRPARGASLRPLDPELAARRVEHRRRGRRRHGLRRRRARHRRRRPPGGRRVPVRGGGARRVALPAARARRRRRPPRPATCGSPTASSRSA